MIRFEIFMENFSLSSVGSTYYLSAISAGQRWQLTREKYLQQQIKGKNKNEQYRPMTPHVRYQQGI